MSSIPEGTIITCPKCNKELYANTIEITYGTKVTALLFRGISQEPKPFEPIKSHCCGELPLMVETGKYHTKDGWR